MRRRTLTQFALNHPAATEIALVLIFLILAAIIVVGLATIY